MLERFQIAFQLLRLYNIGRLISRKAQLSFLGFNVLTQRHVVSEGIPELILTFGLSWQQLLRNRATVSLLQRHKLSLRFYLRLLELGQFQLFKPILVEQCI